MEFDTDLLNPIGLIGTKVAEDTPYAQNAKYDPRYFEMLNRMKEQGTQDPLKNVSERNASLNTASAIPTGGGGLLGPGPSFSTAVGQRAKDLYGADLARIKRRNELDAPLMQVQQQEMAKKSALSYADSEIDARRRYLDSEITQRRARSAVISGIMGGMGSIGGAILGQSAGAGAQGTMTASNAGGSLGSGLGGESNKSSSSLRDPSLSQQSSNLSNRKSLNDYREYG